MRREELKFANDARNAVENTRALGAWMLLFFIAVLFAASVVWASWATVEQTTVGVGRVIPSRQIQKVESLDPGIVTEILVQEGDRVEIGQGLVRIDDTGASSKLGELRQRQSALKAELYRLEKQAALSQDFKVPAAAGSAELAYYEDQQAVFLAEKRSLEERLAILRNQLLQRRQNLQEAEATLVKQAETLKIAERELELTTRLFKRKAVPELEYLKIQRLVSELRGDQAITGSAKVRIEAEVSEAKKMIDAEQSTFVAAARERISRVKADLSVVVESLRAAEDRVLRTLFRSPVAGVVNKLHVAAIGEVVQTGMTLAEIVPAGDRLLFETRIRPQDVAFIRPGLKATIRLSAYDFTKYGTLAGIVERIGADTITDENRETFYQVTVATDDSQEIPEEITIIPGMIAEVEVSSGDRTVLEYLLKPVIRVRDKALREPN